MAENTEITEATRNQIFLERSIALPTDFSEVKLEEATSLQSVDLLPSDSHGYLNLVAMDETFIYIEKIMNQYQSDLADQVYYKYNVHTNEITKEDKYAEVWVNTKYPKTHHIKLFDKEGNSKEIFQKTENHKTELFSYVLNNNKVYEYAQINQLSEPYVNIYDLSGNLLSSTYLAAVADALSSDAQTAVTQFEAFGNYVAVTVCIGVSKKTFIYNMESNFFLKMDECHYLPSASNHSSIEKNVLMSYPYSKIAISSAFYADGVHKK